jgi:peptidoglycan biosynthesis protein MviN/MurJ (putative lipid II flippase)
MTALLPYFSKLKYKEKEEIEYHYTQALMFITWMTLPIVFLMTVFSYKIFQTLYASRFTPDNIIETGNNLIAYLIALPFMAGNRFLLNVCYIYKITFAPVIIAIVTTGCNYVLNKLLISSMGTAGLALGTSIACILQTIFYILLIHYKAHIKIDFKKFITFLFNYSTQLILASSILYLIYQGLYTIIAQQTFTKDLIFFTINQSFFTEGLGFWMWVGPLCAVYLASLYGTKKWFNIEIFYL